MKRRTGLHLRIDGSLVHLIEQAIRLQIPFFQSFLLSQVTNTYITISDAELTQFLKLRRAHFDRLFAHASYWINPAGSCYRNAQKILLREVELAKRLEFTHLILHPGAKPAEADHERGIDNVARILNAILKKEHHLRIVIENTAHGGNSIGSDITDFTHILNKLDYPEKLFFCIDTAHAFSYGYNIADDEQQDEFIALLEKTVPPTTIVLLHLNDTKEKLASRIDQHGIIGKGTIGKQSLLRFAQQAFFAQTPLILELPLLSEAEQVALLQSL